MSIKWLGWSAYTDSGMLYRRWQFKEAVPGLNAEPNDTLDDLGPQVSPRFWICKYSKGEKPEWDCTPTEEEVMGSGEFPHGFPPWTPPAPEGLLLQGSIEEVRDAVQDMAQAIRSDSDASRKLEEVRNILDGEAGPQKEPGLSNRFLRLKGEHEYTSGDPFTDWELLVDVPEIPVTRSDASPRHAVKGDVLREEADDELTPFQLRRGGRRIGDPEWWQVRHLFEGLKEGVSSASPVAPPPGAQAVRRVLPEGAERIGAGAFFAVRAVPEVGIRKGDVVVKVHVSGPCPFTRKKYRDRARGVIHRIPRRLFGTLADHVDALEHVEGYAKWMTPDRLHSYLTNPKAQSGRDDTSRIIVVRPLVSPVSEPIQARTDEEAVFELLYQVDRGMNPEGADDA